MKAIYAIVNLLTGHQYIGSTINFYKRKIEHVKQLNHNYHHSKYLQRVWNKHGPDCFRFIILEKIIDDTALIQREQWWIDNSHSEYNMCKIAGSSLGIKRTEETKERIRQANLGLKHPDWRNKIKAKAQSGDTHWSKRKKFSDESRKKMSETHKRLYANGYIHPCKGIKQSDERRKINSESHKGLISKKRIKVKQYSKDMVFIKEFSSCSHAASETGISRTVVYNAVTGKHKTKGGGYIWLRSA
jgi:group I intron endonuclease